MRVGGDSTDFGCVDRVAGMGVEVAAKNLPNEAKKMNGWHRRDFYFPQSLQSSHVHPKTRPRLLLRRRLCTVRSHHEESFVDSLLLLLRIKRRHPTKTLRRVLNQQSRRMSFKLQRNWFIWQRVQFTGIFISGILCRITGFF